MTEPLKPCTECGRHVRTSDGACPFCDAPPPPLDPVAPMTAEEELLMHQAVEYGMPPMELIEPVEEPTPEVDPLAD